ncbi:MAG: hypothetical protein ABIG95_07205 [Candidatus Woesearchaeota archaeon]
MPRLEASLSEAMGVELNRQKITGETCARLEPYVPYMHWEGRVMTGWPETLSQQLQNCLRPVSMLFKGERALKRVAWQVYTVAFAHYALAIRDGLTHNGIAFPAYCCGPSCDNVALSLIQQGYPTAHMASKLDHCVVGLPFVLVDPMMQGCIVVDPTSDQKKKNGEPLPKNLLFLGEGANWEYKIGAFNFFPQTVLDCNAYRRLCIQGLSPAFDGALYLIRTDNFFRECFSNTLPSNLD